jgi:predicted Zn-dependent protease
MSWHSMLTCALPALALAVACATSEPKPIRDPAFTPEADERELWEQAARLSEKLEASPLLLRSVELETYLEDVALRLLRAHGSGSLAVRVRVLRDPIANAFALPNGHVYLHTGLLAPMRNEAQLAAVLGHELTHYLARHALREQRAERSQEKSRQIAVGTAFVLGVAGLTPLLWVAVTHEEENSLVTTLMRAQLAGYSRELEHEADQVGAEMLRGAGYRPGEMLRVLELLREEADATTSDVPYVYASHPRIQERIESVVELLDDSEEPGRVGATEYQQQTVDVLLVNARLELDSGAVQPAQRNLENYLALRPDGVGGRLLLAEAYRREGPERAHLLRAAAALEKAPPSSPESPELHRDLGLLYRELQDWPRARASLTRYVGLAPDAPDRPIIERYLSELP